MEPGRPPRRRRRWLRRVLGFASVPLVLLVALNLWVLASGRSRVYGTGAAPPATPVALVLGTSKRRENGRPNPHFQGRMEAAARLFKAGRVRHVLVSGACSGAYYNEPKDMKAALMAHGRFATQALAPLVYNGSIILGGLLFADTLGAEGFAWGALIGAAVGTFGIAWLDARVGLGLRMGLRVAPFDADVRRYVAVAAPLMLGLSLAATDEWYDRWFGGLLAAGTVAHLSFARRLMQLPVAVVGQALPEGEDAVEHFVGGLEEAGLVEAGLGPLLAELLLRVLRVLVLQLVVEGPEAQREGGHSLALNARRPATSSFQKPAAAQCSTA